MDMRMSVKEALKNLGFSDIPTIAELNKAFRLKARREHPDAGGNEADFKITNESNYTLKNYIEANKQKEKLLKASQKINIIIDLMTFEKLVRGEFIVVQSSDGSSSHKVTFEDVNKGAINLLISEDIHINVVYPKQSVIYEASSVSLLRYVPYTINTFKVSLSDYYKRDEIDLKAKVYNKELETTSNAEIINFAFKIGHVVFKLELWRDYVNDD